MTSPLRTRVLGWLRIPEQAHLPEDGTQEPMILHAGRGYLTLLRVKWLLGFAGGLVGLFLGLSLASLYLESNLARHLRLPRDTVHVVLWIMELGAFATLIFGALARGVTLNWDYECRYYILTDHCLRIQEGLWSWREQTFTLRNIQDITLRQGPLQRFFGIADLVVQTAGGGSKPEAGSQHHEDRAMHTGVIRGVADAEALRDFLLARLRSHASTPKEKPPKRGPIHTVVQELRAAREALERTI